MNEGVNWELLAKYLAGECTKVETQRVLAWLDADIRNQQYYQQLQQLWQESPEDYAQALPNSTALWQKLQTSIGQERPFAVVAEKRPVQQVLNSGIWRVAAAVLLLIGLGWATYYGWETTHSVVQLTHVTEQKALTLPDGTRVWLNEESKLTYATDFGEDDRVVSLEGEAYFEVVHLKKNQPFTIRTPKTQTTVLGTSFNVNTHHTGVMVTVVTGKVAFAKTEGKKEKVLLTKNFRGMYDPRSQVLIKELNPDLNFMAWKTGVLTFDKTPITQVIQVLSGYYHQDIRLQNSAAGTCRFTGTFDHQSLEKVIETLRLTFDASTVQRGKTLFIQDIHCQ